MAFDLVSAPSSERTRFDAKSSTLKVFRLLAIYSLSGILYFAIAYLEEQTWQLIAAATLLAISIVITSIGYRQAKKVYQPITNILIFIGQFLAFVAPITLLANHKGYPILIGTLAALPTNMVIHKSWKKRIVSFGLFMLLTYLFSQISIFSHLYASFSLAWIIYFFATVIFLIIQAILLLFLDLELRTIKARLLISFVTIATIPMIIVVGVATFRVLRTTEKSATDLLTAVVNLKKNAIDTWVGYLDANVQERANLFTENNSVIELLTGESSAQTSEQLYSDTFYQLETIFSESGDFQEYLLLDPQGNVVLSTNPSHSSINIGQEPIFADLINDQVVHKITKIDDLGGNILLITAPILNQARELTGYLAGAANFERLTQIMREGDALGETGEVYLIASDLTLLTDPEFHQHQNVEAKIFNTGTLDAVLGYQTGNASYKNHAGVNVFAAYRWMDDLGIAIIAEQSRSEVLLPVVSTIIWISVVSILLITGAVIFGLSISNSIGKPLAELTSISKRISAGELDMEAAVHHRKDEISELAEAFNLMTQQLRVFINDLERRVQERTSELEIRNAQLIATSQLGSAITSYLDIDELVQQAVDLIKEKFNLYYVGLFLLDETHTWAILKAGTGHAGQSLLEQDHRIKVGEGMVGWCIQNALARIALQAGEDPVRLATPDLPETRSEAAIPLRSRGLVIGALTIQSNHRNAFDQATVTIFQTMADQIAVAIDNALLIQQAQKAIEATRRAYGELSHRAWIEQISSKKIRAHCSDHGVSITSYSKGSSDNHASISATASFAKDENMVNLPITVRGSVLGVLRAEKHLKAGEWTDEETEMLQTLIEQLGAALESARLFEETLTKAERERMIGHIASRVRETLDIEMVLQTATLEMQKALDLEEVEVLMNQNILPGKEK